MNQIKGIITTCKFEKKYDRDGISYKDYVINVNNQQYTTQIKEQIYLQAGMTVLLAIKPDSANEVMAGYCLKEGYTWGENAGKLKKEVAPTEKYNFLEGTILEKQKSTTGSIYMDRTQLASWRSRIGYTIVLENSSFHVSNDEGEYLQVGMDIAAVLDKNTSVIILDKAADKYLGVSQPYYIIFLLAIILFNGYMYFSKQTPFVNINVVLIVVNIFLVLAGIISFATFRITNSAKKFLLSKMNT